MMSDTTFPSATINITCRATTNIGGSTCRKVLGVKEIIDCTACSCCINILVDRTAEQGNVGCTIDITTQRCCSLSPATAVGIIYHCGPLVDDNIGVVFLIDRTIRSNISTIIYLSSSNNGRIAEIDIFIGNICCKFSSRVIITRN